MSEQPSTQWMYTLQLVERLRDEDAWTDQDRSVVQQHFNYLKELTESGTMILVGRSERNLVDTRGVAIYIAVDESAAREIMNNDPCVRQGVMTAELVPFRIALLSSRRDVIG